jgi:hypothetical protein
VTMTVPGAMVDCSSCQRSVMAIPPSIAMT